MKYILLGGLLLYSSAAMGQTVCDKRDNILELLAQKYEETPIAVAITSDGRLLEVLSPKDGTTWTIIMSTPDGTSCILASGEEWKTLNETDLDPRA